MNMRDLAFEVKQIWRQRPQSVNHSLKVLEHIDAPEEKFDLTSGYEAIRDLLSYSQLYENAPGGAELVASMKGALKVKLRGR